MSLFKSSDKPLASDWWRHKKQWQNNSIASSAKSNTVILWGFCAFWNAISYTPFIGDKNVLDEIPRNPVAAVVFLFPFVGLIIFGIALKSTREWLKYGKTPLTLDPFPAAIGGQCGGTITLNQTLSEKQEVKAVLSCRKSYYTGSGKNRRRTEKVLWQNEGYCEKHTIRSVEQQQTRLAFCFDVPSSEDGLIMPSEPDQQNEYILWKLALEGKFYGPDLIREYIIPVVHSDTKLSSLSINSNQHPLSQTEADDGVYEVANIQTITDGVQLYFPALRRPGPGIAWSVFGAIFTCGGLFAFTMGAPIIIVGVSCCVGGGILIGGLFNLAKSLHVNVTRKGLNTRRFVLGYPIKSKHLDTDKIKQILIKQVASTQHGNTTTVIYQLFAVSLLGKKLVIAERLNKRSEAERLKELYETYLGLKESN